MPFPRILKRWLRKKGIENPVPNPSETTFVKSNLQWEYQIYAVEKFLEYQGRKVNSILEIGSDLSCDVISCLGRMTDGIVFGINSSPSFNKNQKVLPQNVMGIQTDGKKLPFRNNSFGGVLSIATIEHVLDLAGFLGECYRVMQPGAMFYALIGPIWSCSVGHHLYARVPGTQKEARFHKAGKNPLPDFSHLLWGEEKMREFLETSPCDDRLIAPIIDWVYHRNDINRLFYEDYVRHYEESQLDIISFQARPRSKSEIPTGQIKNDLVEKFGPEVNFDNAVIEVLAKKPGKADQPRTQKDIREFIRNNLVCPRMGQTLALNESGSHLQSRDGSIEYEVKNDIAVIL